MGMDSLCPEPGDAPDRTGLRTPELRHFGTDPESDLGLNRFVGLVGNEINIQIQRPSMRPFNRRIRAYQVRTGAQFGEHFIQG